MGGISRICEDRGRHWGVQHFHQFRSCLSVGSYATPWPQFLERALLLGSRHFSCLVSSALGGSSFPFQLPLAAQHFLLTLLSLSIPLKVAFIKVSSFKPSAVNPVFFQNFNWCNLPSASFPDLYGRKGFGLSHLYGVWRGIRRFLLLIDWLCMCEGLVILLMQIL